jgi:heptosyltransferase-1
MRIAIVKLSALGDIINAMVVLQYIKKFDKNITIDWIVESNYKGLLEFHPDVNKVHEVRLKNAKKKKSLYLFLKELSKLRQLKKYDLVFDLQGLVKSAIVSKIIPSKKTLGFDRYSIREPVASFFYNQVFTLDYSTNVILRNILLCNSELKLNFNRDLIIHKQPFLFSQNSYIFEEISRVVKNILIVPGASFESKIYPKEKYAAVINQLDANFIVIWGNENEKSIAYDIRKMCPKVVIAEKLSLDSLISLVSKVDLLIGGDTGPSHMAWALNIPSIILFGPTPGFRNTFTTDINKIFESDSEVIPTKINKNDFSIKNIEASEIVKMAKYLLIKNK